VSAADVQREGERKERAIKERRLKPGDVQMTNVGNCDLTKTWLVIDAGSFKDGSSAATGIAMSQDASSMAATLTTRGLIARGDLVKSFEATPKGTWLGRAAELSTWAPAKWIAPRSWRPCFRGRARAALRRSARRLDPEGGLAQLQHMNDAAKDRLFQALVEKGTA
jgi:hypothetical protein